MMAGVVTYVYNSPIEHSVQRLMDDMYFKDGSIRDRLTRIEERLEHMPTKAYILAVILTVGIPTLLGIAVILVRLFK